MDNEDDMKAVEQFYQSQFKLFQNADALQRQIQKEKDFYAGNEEVDNALALIKDIVTYRDNYNYSRIPQLNGAIQTIMEARNTIIALKREEFDNVIKQCFASVENKAKEDPEKLAGLLNQARIEFERRKEETEHLIDLNELEAKIQNTFNEQDRFIRLMDNAKKKAEPKQPEPSAPKEPVRKVKEYYRQTIFPQKTLKNEKDVNNYIDELRAKLMNLISDGDEVKLK